MCAAPTAPTLSTLVSEALKKAGQSNPDSVLTTRAEDLWMNEIKNDILVLVGGRKLKALYISSVTVTVNGRSRYSCPTDYFADMTMDLLDGTVRGTATGGAVGSITLASNEDVVGSNILIRGGTGVGSMSECTAFNTSTLVATVSPNFTTAPASGSTYTIIDQITRLTERHRSHKPNNSSRGNPTKFYPLGDADYGEFELYPTPYTTDSHVFGLQMNYYINLLTIDLAGTLITTLYQRWRNVWLQGVFTKALEELNDKRVDKQQDIYKFMLQELVARETYGMDMSNLQARIMDY